MASRVSLFPDAFYRVSVKAVIRNNHGDVLVVKEHDSKYWDLPGGGFTHGETPKGTLARELYEEVGFAGDFTAKLMTTATFWLEPKQAWLLWVVYEVKTDNQNFSVGVDSREVEFINPIHLKSDESWSEQWIYENL